MRATRGIDQPREVSVVINLRSRLGLQAAERALKELKFQGVRITEHHLIHHGHEVEDTVREMLDRGRRTIVIDGGDGTISLTRSKAPGRGLSVYTPRDTRLSTILRLVIGLWVTRQQQASLLYSLTGDSIQVVADPRQDVDVDGKYCCLTPVKFRLAEDALRVIVSKSDERAE